MQGMSCEDGCAHTCDVRGACVQHKKRSQLTPWKYVTFFYFTKIKVDTLSINEIIPFSLAFAMPQVEESQKKSSKDHNNEEKVGPNRRFFFTSPLDSLFGKVHKEW
jgi:hypothetical protein